MCLVSASPDHVASLREDAAYHLDLDSSKEVFIATYRNPSPAAALETANRELAPLMGVHMLTSKTPAALILVALFALPSIAQDPSQDANFKNLKVLPADISDSELSEHMLENLRGLGLRRLAGEGCLACHVGDLETPRDRWDYASDQKPMKRKARTMMAMVEAINSKYLGGLEARLDASFRVTCITCHAGRVDPRPLPDVLWSAYEEGGISSATKSYRELRRRYFGTGAYDFRVGVLQDIALRMADQGAFDDAIALADLNAEVHPNASAKRASLAIELEKTIDSTGVDAALEQLDQAEPTLSRGVVTSGLLDSLAWRLNRTEREAQGHALIEANHAKYPRQYVPLESLAFIRADAGRMKEALELVEQWLAEHPDHARARRLLLNLRAEGDE